MSLTHDEPGKTLTEIASRLAVSPERARQIIAKAFYAIPEDLLAETKE